jgi:D-amino peptidase
MYMMEGLDASFDAVFFISYHGSMGSDASVLSHTYYPAAIAEVTINGVVAGESGINALVALAYGVPVVLVTGDLTTARETEAFCPGLQRVVVKESVSRFAASSLHPERARQLITEAACLAIASLSSARPVAISLPATMAIGFKSSDYAELAARVAGCERTGALSAQLCGDDPLELYRTFITIVLLCRGLQE